MPSYTVSNVNVGAIANDGQGDPLRTAFIKINQNLSNVYAYANLAYYNGLGGNANGGGGNVTTVTNFYGGAFEGWPNITASNLSILTGKLANIAPTNLGALANALANVAAVNLTALNNALATVNVTSLSNFTNVINSLTANASSSNTKVGLVSTLSANGTSNGQAVYNTTDGGLYIWSGNAWISPSAAFTPTANSISGVEIFTYFALPGGPGDGRDFNGRQGFYNGNLYLRSSGAWSSYNSFITGSGTPVLSAGIITATELAAGSVIAGKIGAAAISAAEIQANAITASKIAANAIIAGKIDAGVITAAEIAAGAITATAIAANAITAIKIEANAITSNKIAANAITAVQLAANAVYANAIIANAITAAQIAANAITAVQLAANSVYADALQANCITANQIAANAITSVEIAANAVYAGAIQAGAITANTIAANAITAVHVGANVITAAMIDSRGLSIRDLNGNVLFAAGTGVLSANVLVSVPGGGTQTLAALTANATPKYLMLNNDAPGFGVSGGTFTNQSNILLTANLYGMTGTATFSVTGGTGTLTATSDPNSKKLFFVDMLTDAVTIKASFTSGGSTYDDIVSLYKVYNGNTTPLMYLTDENRTLPADNGGTVSSFSGVATEAVVYLGLVNDTNNWAFNSTASGCTITQSGTGNRTITITAMSADTATVTVVGSRSGYSNLTRIYKLSKAKQGAQGTAGTNGTNGTNGTRGSITTSGSASSWSDAAAYAAIVAAGGGTPIITDQVTLSNGSSFAETKVCSAGGNPGTWTTVVALFNGSILVNGTVVASKIAAGAIDASKIAADTITSAQIAAGAITASEIAAGAITADKITASSATIASTGLFGFGSGFNIQGYGAVGGFESTSASYFGMIGASNNTNPGGVFANRGTAAGSAASFFKFRNGTYTGGSANMYTNAAICEQTYAGYFTSFWTGSGLNNNGAILCTPAGGPAGAFTYYNSSGTLQAQIQIAVNAFAAYAFNGTYGPFTGAHDGLLEKGTTYEIGDIVVDYQLVAKPTVNDSITIVKLSSQAKQKSVIGVISKLAENHVPTSISEYDPSSNTNILINEFQSVYDTNDGIVINSIGEGCINVCGQNGNIEIGDYITSSSIPGKGMNQDDDLMRNYTVAKARENVTFASPTEVKMIACTYHCG